MPYLLAALFGCIGAFVGVALTLLFWRLRDPATVRLLILQRQFAREAGRGAYRRRSH